MNNAPEVAVSQLPTKSQGQGKKLLEVATEVLDRAGLEEKTALRYVSWMLEFILFHGKRHPSEMGVPEIRLFLEDGRFSGSRAPERVEATAALRFLYEEVLNRRWPRDILETSPPPARGGEPPVYLNGQQQDVKLLDRVRNALRVGQYALEIIRLTAGETTRRTN